MSDVDLTELQRWVGHAHEDQDVAALRHARLMAAALGQDPAALRAGDALPPLWHWLYFLEGLPPAQLGRDGHPARGGFLPPVPLPNRMWAGGRVQWLAPVPLGAPMQRTSRVARIEAKAGRSGPLVFVAVEHTVRAEGADCLHEVYDIVYTGPRRPAAVPADVPPASAGEPLATLTPDATLLFRYSALTFNGHRIHYDADYCREVEGYSGLVVHGPLQATWLAGLAQQRLGRPLHRFDYRALAPAIAGQTLTARLVEAAAGGLTLASTLPSGGASMRAQVWA